MTDNYLYRITTKRSDVWSNATPKAVYFVAPNKEYALRWAEQNLATGLSVAKIVCLATQVGGHIFTAN